MRKNESEKGRNIDQEKDVMIKNESEQEIERERDFRDFQIQRVKHG